MTLGGSGPDAPSRSPPQYFEYTSQRELRHNIGKELCLRAGAGAAELGECQYRGKPGQVPGSEEWDLAQVRLRNHRFGWKNPSGSSNPTVHPTLSLKCP